MVQFAPKSWHEVSQELTTRCWNSQDRITLVACFGSTPLFCFLPPLVVKSLSQSSAEPPGVVGAGDRGPDVSLAGTGHTLAPICERGVEPCTTMASGGGWGRGGVGPP